MWVITLKILSVVGIILLILLGFILLLTLLVLFCPVVYRLQGKKTAEEFRVSAGAGWLFGILRLSYSYPEPGTLRMKVLWKTVFDSSQRKEKLEDADAEKGKKAGADRETAKGRKTAGSGEKAGVDGETAKGRKAAGSGEKAEVGEEAARGRKAAGADGETAAAGERRDTPESRELSVGNADPSPGEEKKAGNTAEKSSAAGDKADDSSEVSGEESAASETDGKTGILEKLDKIKYTIQKICDKIKEIWENLSYYEGLLQEENTARLWRHVTLRLAKILKSIRPRQIRADILFGAAAPDTTGYVYGVYCMFFPVLGEKVVVTPDFTQEILQGEAELSGRITGGVLVWNALKLLLDRKLHLFLKKIKAGRRRDGG